MDPTDHAASGVFVSAADVTAAAANLAARVRVRNAGAPARRAGRALRLCDRDQREALVMEAPARRSRPAA